MRTRPGPSLIRNIRSPASLLGGMPCLPEPDGMVRYDLLVEDGRILDLLPGGAAPAAMETMHDQGGGLALPLFADLHTHLDKSLIWDRAPNPDGTFMGAVTAVTRDRESHWTPEDVRHRMGFALDCAYAHGTGALRTHLDTIGTHGAAVWPLFRELQAEWAERMTVQAVSLVMLERYLEDGAQGIAREVAATPGACLGAVIMIDNATEERLDALFALAEEHGCGLDLHVDENDVASGTALEVVARVALRRRFLQPILCGHCCSLSRQQEGRQREIVAQVRDAGIGVVSLPSCNLYLQDRASGRTPRWRGVTLVHELDAAGVPVMFASDNVRDPFFAYGDYDMVEVFAQAVRIAHLDAPFGNWADAVTRRPAAWMGRPGTIAAGQPADLVLFSATSLNELVSRPSAGRTVMRAGVPLALPAPDYRRLASFSGMG